MRICLAVAFSILLLGCEKPAPAKATGPSLDSTNSAERQEAARQMGEKFGGTKP